LELAVAEIATNFNDFWPTIRVKHAFENSHARDGRGGIGKGLRERYMLRDFSKALRELLRIPGENGGAYRPDLHYMRGPGPKWHAKHAGFIATPSGAKPSRPALHEIVERRA